MTTEKEKQHLTLSEKKARTADGFESGRKSTAAPGLRPTGCGFASAPEELDGGGARGPAGWCDGNAPKIHHPEEPMERRAPF